MRKDQIEEDTADQRFKELIWRPSPFGLRLYALLFYEAVLNSYCRLLR